MYNLRLQLSSQSRGIIRLLRIFQRTHNCKENTCVYGMIEWIKSKQVYSMLCGQ